jgi:hypothetical protein
MQMDAERTNAHAQCMVAQVVGGNFVKNVGLHMKQKALCQCHLVKGIIFAPAYAIHAND